MDRGFSASMYKAQPKRIQAEHHCSRQPDICARSAAFSVRSLGLDWSSDSCIHQISQQCAA
jgi:hypothetical protein